MMMKKMLKRKVAYDQNKLKRKKKKRKRKTKKNSKRVRFR
jgi:hypothetical protein